MKTNRIIVCPLLICEAITKRMSELNMRDFLKMITSKGVQFHKALHT